MSAAIFTEGSPLATAALYVGLLVFLMMGLKMWVGGQRGRLKVPPGDHSNPEFGRALRVQHNAVEDVPVLMVGLLSLAVLGAPVWSIHLIGAGLVVSRILHAAGLAGAAGFSFGRLVGTLGTLLCYVGVGGTLLVLAFQSAP
jgi:uncharacterized protein